MTNPKKPRSFEVQFELPVRQLATNRRLIHKAKRSSWITFAGIMGTLSLHALVFQAIVLGVHAPRIKRPESQGSGATAIKSQSDPSLTLVIVDLPGTLRQDADLLEEISSIGAQSKDAPLIVVSPDPLPSLAFAPESQDKDPDLPAARDEGDPLGRAAQYALYTGQIGARIERAWRRPRSPVNSESKVVAHATAAEINATQAFAEEKFKCQVKILQDAQGNVLETLLLKCNGTEDWRHSLIAAINQASPLPAPPTVAVFANALTMTFTAYAFSSGSVLDEYAPEDRSPQIANVVRTSGPAELENQRTLETEVSGGELADTAESQ